MSSIRFLLLASFLFLIQGCTSAPIDARHASTWKVLTGEQGMRNYNQGLREKLAVLQDRSSDLSRQMLVELGKVRNAQTQLDSAAATERFSAQQLADAEAALAAREADGRAILDQVLETKGEVTRLQQAEAEAKLSEAESLRRSAQLEQENRQAEIDIEVFKRIKRDHRLRIIEDSLRN